MVVLYVNRCTGCGCISLHVHLFNWINVRSRLWCVHTPYTLSLTQHPEHSNLFDLCECELFRQENHFDFRSLFFCCVVFPPQSKLNAFFEWQCEQDVIYDNMQWKIYHYWLLSYRSMGQFVRISPASVEIERFTWFNEWIIHIWHCKAIFAPERKIVYSIINESKLFLEIIVQRLHWEKWIALSAVSVYSGLFI